MVISQVYSINADNKPLGPLLKRGAAVSVQIETLSGTVASVGTFKLQSSNSQLSWVDENPDGVGTPGLTTTGIFQYGAATGTTPNPGVLKQAVQVICLTQPSGGVKVTLYADGIHE